MTNRINPVIWIWVFLNIVFVYSFLSFHTRFIYAQNGPFAYYNLLIQSLTKGHLYIESPVHIMDMSLFENKYYLYWGPAPILFILPFYIFGGGPQASDFIYCLVAGLINIALFYILLKTVVRFYHITITPSSQYLIWIVFALSSPNLYCSVNGGVWQTSQVVGMLYLLTFLIMFFKYAISPNKYHFLILSALAFNLAWLSRYGMFLYILFPIIYGFRMNKRYLQIFAPITLCFIIFFMIYNVARFHHPFDVGTNYMQKEFNIIDTDRDRTENIKLHEADLRGEQYSIKYVPRSFFYLFLNPVFFSTKQPFVETDSMGNGIFFMYPFLSLIFGYFYKKKLMNSKQTKFLLIAAAICGLYILGLLMYIGTGYHQVGNRYIFDIIPLLLISIAMWVGRIPKFISWALLVYGSVINIAAIFAYYLGGIFL